MTIPKNWEKAAEQLRRWFREGRDIPYYSNGSFHPWLSKMLGVNYKALDPMFDEAHDELFRQIVGPHGWAVVQILLVKYRERLNEEWRNENERR